jgi:MFS family permease
MLGMLTIASTPGVARVFGSSVIARLPLAMLSIALLVHAERLTGSFAVAGAVSGAYAIATGIGGPLLGRVVDRRGQTAVLLASAAVEAALLIVAAVLPAGVSAPVLVAIAAALGLASPPLGACVRTLFPGLLADAGAVRKAYAVDASVVELTWISGPPLALGLGALFSTGAALAAAGAVLLLGTAAFAAHPASRNWRPEPAGEPQRGGALRAPAMRTLVAVLLAAGVLFGAVEVAVAAATGALGSTAAAGPLLGIWGVGSLLGGLLATRFGAVADSATGLVLVLAALAAGHLALVAAAGSVIALAATLLIAGMAIAPTYAGVYMMVDRAAPAGTATEAFAWLATATAVGAAAGAAGAGALVEAAGPTAAFVLGGGAGVVATIVALMRAESVPTAAVTVGT